MTKKQILRTAVLILILLSLMYPLSRLFSYESSHMSERYTTYYNLPKDTVDVLLVGTSGIDRYWIAAKGYEQYGITGYPLSFDAMPSWLIPNVLIDAVKVQSPKLVVIDMRMFTVSYTDSIRKYESPVHRVVDLMDMFSLNRLDAVTKSVKILAERVGVENFSPLSFYLPFIKYHPRWSEADYSMESMKREPSAYLGLFLESSRSMREVQLRQTVRTDEHIALDPTCAQALEEMLAYLDGQNYDVLFLNTPKYLSKTTYGRTNTLCSILDERGYKYQCYDAEDGTYNLNTDFYNKTHVNYKGAEKFTDVFAAYLKENYDLPDRRLDEACQADWEGVYDEILAVYEEWDRQHMSGRPQIDVESAQAGNMISWQIPDQDGGYIIYRSSDPGMPYEAIQVIEDGFVTSFTDESAEPGVSYSYMVRPFKRSSDGVNYGPYSNEKCIDP